MESEEDVANPARLAKQSRLPLGRTRGRVAAAPEPLTDSAVPLTPLPPIHISSQLASTNVRAWQAVRDSLRVDPAVYSLPLPTRSIFECPVFQAREYTSEVVEVQDVFRKSRNRHVQEAMSVTIWQIEVYDTTLGTTSPRLTLFPHIRIPTGLNDFGVLSSDIFNREQVDQFAKDACQILNRLPWDLSAEMMYLDPGIDTVPGHARGITELLLLQTLGTAFSATTIFPDALARCSDTSMPFVHTAPKNSRPICPVPYVDTKFGLPILHGDQCKFVVGGRLNIEKVSLLPPVPATYWLAGDPPLLPMTVKDRDFNVFLGELIRYIRTTIGLQFGTRDQISARVEDLATAFKVDNARRSIKLLDDDSDVFQLSVAKNSKKVRVLLTPSAQKRVTGGKVPPVVIEKNSKVLIAYVLQCMYTALLKDGLLHAMQSGAIAADKVNTRTVRREHAKEAHCDCPSQASRYENVHACMKCGAPRFCVELIDAPGDRRICVSCEVESGELEEDERDSPEPDPVPAVPKARAVRKPRAKSRPKVPAKAPVRERRARVRTYNAEADFRTKTNRLEKNILKEFEEAGRSVDPAVSASAVSKIQTYWTDKDWWDEYCQMRRPKTRDVTKSKDPRQFSIEAANPFITIGGDNFYHHEQNILLTALALNYAKSTKVPAYMPLLRMALIEGEKPVPDWTRVNTHLDHIHRIAGQTPAKRSTRLKLKLKAHQAADFEAMCRTGVYKTVVAISKQMSNNTAMRRIEIVRGPENRPIIKMHKKVLDMKLFEDNRWDDTVWAQILSMINAIENDPVTNPENRRIPRVNGVPWPWRREHAPDDLSYTFINLEMIARYEQMDEFCDEENESQESPKTLYYSLCIQHLESPDGLVDPILKMPLTCYSRHPQNYSIGRALHVAPGSQMRSGFTSPDPTQFPAEYNPGLRSISAHSWLMNEMCLDFDPEVDDEGVPHLPDIMKGLIREIAPSCRFYDVPRTDLAVINYPKQWRKMSWISPFAVETLTKIGFKLDETSPEGARVVAAEGAEAVEAEAAEEEDVETAGEYESDTDSDYSDEEDEDDEVFPPTVSRIPAGVETVIRKPWSTPWTESTGGPSRRIPAGVITGPRRAPWGAAVPEPAAPAAPAAAPAAPAAAPAAAPTTLLNDEEDVRAALQRDRNIFRRLLTSLPSNRREDYMEEVDALLDRRLELEEEMNSLADRIQRELGGS